MGRVCENRKIKIGKEEKIGLWGLPFDAFMLMGERAAVKTYT